MKYGHTAMALAVLCACTPPAEAASGSLSAAVLAAAGQQAQLRDLDYPSTRCDGATSVGEWLQRLVADEARTVAWSGGRCRLVNSVNPLDAADWPYCAQATITLRHPKARGDKPMIEIYFEKPVRGRPGAAYAFRSLMLTRDDGPDYLRHREDFEAEWRERFPNSPPPACAD